MTGCRAFEDLRYDYYELTQNLGGVLKKGTIFVHDTDDCIRGSNSEGCLKLCYDKNGNTQGYLCADTVVFHVAFIKSDMFKLVKKGNKKERELKLLIEHLENELSEAKSVLKNL